MVMIDMDRRLDATDGTGATLLTHHLRNFIGTYSVSALQQEIGVASIQPLRCLLHPLVVAGLAVGRPAILGGAIVGKVVERLEASTHRASLRRR
jgi:hypothetical protein